MKKDTARLPDEQMTSVLPAFEMKEHAPQKASIKRLSQDTKSTTLHNWQTMDGKALLELATGQSQKEGTKALHTAATRTLPQPHVAAHPEDALHKRRPSRDAVLEANRKEGTSSVDKAKIRGTELSSHH